MSELRFLTGGESHGPAVTVILEGLPAGLPLDASVIDAELVRRQMGFGAGARMKIEKDSARVLGGIMAGHTTGAPLVVMIENRDHRKWVGKAVDARTVPRPGHADLAAAVKYGYNDLRPGLERASARETAARVAAGAVCKHFLTQLGIRVGGYTRSIGSVDADLAEISLEERLALAEDSDVRCPEPGAAEAMHAAIWAAMKSGETLGGIIEVLGLNLPVGLGSHVQWDRRLDARLAMAVMSIPAIKGVSIGPAFENARLPGTRVHDGIRLSGGEITREGNAAGGIEGGISNGQPLVVRAAMKPIPTTLQPQPSVDLAVGQEHEMVYERSDFCPVPRAVVVVEAMVAFSLAQAVLEVLGGDDMRALVARIEGLRKNRLSDLEISSDPKEWWA
jgi:chorismate synthase